MDDRMTESDDAALIKQARERYDHSIEDDRENRERAKNDLIFVYEDQWDERDRQQRETDGLPCFEINDMPQFISQVAGDVRINRPQINVHPVETADRQVADVFEGLIRSIEQASSAPRVYADTLEAGALACGMGHWRLYLDYADDDAFDVDIKVRAIQNPLSVVWDMSGKEPDMSDARYCFVIQQLSTEDFKEKYPDAATTGYYTDHRADGYWKAKDGVTIAEYWTVNRIPQTLCMLANGASVIKEDPDPDVQAALQAFPVIAERKVERPHVEMRIISGRDVLEGPFIWPGDRIPIFTVWGRCGHVGERKVIKSLVHNARDSSRLYNYAASIEAENISKAPKPKWMGTDEMIAGREHAWANANRVSSDFLSYTVDPESPTGKPELIPPIPVDAGIANARAIAADDKKRVIGIYDASLGQRSNETSGIAIQRRDQQADIANYVFVDNLNRAIEATGRELVKVIPKVYSTPRQLRILGPDMEPQIVAVNQQGGIDITVGKYDVVIQSGPGFNTRRQEAAEFYMRFVETNPQFAPFVMPMILRNMDYPGYDEFEQVIQQAMQQMMQPPQPNPADLLNAEKDKADLAGKELINRQRFLDLMAQYGPSAFGPSAPVTAGMQPQFTGTLPSA